MEWMIVAMLQMSVTVKGLTKLRLGDYGAFVEQTGSCANIADFVSRYVRCVTVGIVATTVQMSLTAVSSLT